MMSGLALPLEIICEEIGRKNLDAYTYANLRRTCRAMHRYLPVRGARYYEQRHGILVKHYEEPVHAVRITKFVLASEPFTYHRPDGPALCRWDARGQLVLITYYKHGWRHRADGPAQRIWSRTPTGQLILQHEDYFIDGSYHRADGPAHRVWSTTTGQLQEEAHYKHGTLHRMDGPARRMWCPHTIPMSLLLEEYFCEGARHREEGPARRKWSEVSGDILEEDYFRHDELHRTGGPARRMWFPDGSLMFAAYFENGQAVDVSPQTVSDEPGSPRPKQRRIDHYFKPVGGKQKRPR